MTVLYGNVVVAAEDASGQPLIDGTVTFTQTGDVHADAAFIAAGPVTVRINRQHPVIVKLAAAGTDPGGYTYYVTFNDLMNASGPASIAPFSIVVPAGVTSNLVDIAPVPSSGGSPSGQGVASQNYVNTQVETHVNDVAPHPVYDDAQDLALLFNTHLI